MPDKRLTISDARAATHKLIVKTLGSVPPHISDMCIHLSNGMGKGVRTSLLLICASDNEGLVGTDAVSASAAVELFHLATLVHDDVIDDAPLRRGRPALHATFGRKQAVICGDYILCLAASLIAPIGERYREYDALAEKLARIVASVAAGELRQLQNNRNIDLDVHTYLRIIGGKTAALFCASALAGAAIARHSQREVRALARFGRTFGMVFQIADDCKDYEFSEDKALKTVGRDIGEGIVTLPLILTLRQAPELHLFARYAFDEAGSDQTRKRLIQDVVSRRGTDQARNFCDRLAAKAVRSLRNGGFNPSKVSALTELLEQI
ncbi:MAG: polyprenyl synthetase family protein [Defluviitaleaceae bacterium]|nr:polyprenyl synthetase family protein [Defluviitaleaceae bacterium]